VPHLNLVTTYLVCCSQEVILEDKIHAVTKMSNYESMGIFDTTVHSLTDESDEEIKWAKLTLKRYIKYYPLILHVNSLNQFCS